MFRIGQSTDFHKTDPSRKLILGGLHIENAPGLLGHSDADVLVHAITESIMGAAGLGDLGTLWPDTDPKHKDLDSMVMLKEVMRLIDDMGLKVINIDSIILCEVVKIAPHRTTMENNISKIVGTDNVNVKATTMEGCGTIGSKEGIMAQAVVLLGGK